MISKKIIAASVFASSLLFSNGVISPLVTTASAATNAVNYQTELNSFASHYAQIFRNMESYHAKLDKAKTEQEIEKIYDQYYSYLDKALGNASSIKGLNAEVLKMDSYIYDSLEAVYSLEFEDLTTAESKQAITFINAQDAAFKKAAAAYKAKHKVAFSRDMLYLLDQEADTGAVQGKTYIVKKGDSLYRIAKNNHTTVDALKKLNNLKSDSLKIGQVLKLPAASTPAPVPSPSTYKVIKGDTLSGISKKYKVSVANLKKVNKLKSDHIYVGQVLKLK